MSVVSRDVLVQEALRIKHENMRAANTHQRVGELLVNLIDSGMFGTGSVDLTSYGAKPAIATAEQGAINTAAIQRAADEANRSGGGKVYIPAGDWYFSAGQIDPNVVCQLDSLSRITFQGDGPGVTRLHLLSGANSNFFNMDGSASYITIRDMELDGNRAEQSLGVSGIRSSNISGLWLQNLYIRDIYHYGIGLEGSVQQYLFFDNLKIENCGGDGFDQKNKLDANVHQHASNITVKNFGLNAAEPTQAGWDCRGAWQIANFTCHFSASDGSGIRFRNGEIQEPDVGFGGHYSHLTNFEIFGPGSSSSATGLEIVARDVKVSNGRVRDVVNGVAPTFSAQRSSATDVTVERATNAFLISQGSDYFTMTSCTAVSSSHGFRVRAPNVSIANSQAFAYTTTGITTEQSGSGLNVSNTVLSGTLGTSVGANITTADVTIAGGAAHGNFRGYTTTGVSTKLLGVKAHNNSGAGILVAVGGDDALIDNCTVKSNGAQGVQLRAQRARVIFNEVTSNTSTGIDVVNTATGSVVYGNGFSNNAVSLGDAGYQTTVGFTTVEASVFGASPSATAGQNRSAIQSAINSVSNSGGGIVVLGVGTYNVAASTLGETYWNYGVSVSSAEGCISLRDNVTLRGAGIGKTIIKPSSPTLTAIHVVNGSNASVEDIEIDGQWTSSGAGHAILQVLSTNNVSASINNLKVRGVYAHDVGSYGLGLENGFMTNVLVEDFRSKNTGADGIDIKNRPFPANDSKGIFLQNLYIENPGRRLDGQAGVDVRGLAQLNNVTVVGVGRTGSSLQAGIRFRTLGTDEGWGNRSSVSNFYVSAASSSFDVNGVECGSADVAIVGGTVENATNGVWLTGNANGAADRTSVNSVKVTNALTRGFYIETSVDNASLTNCTALSCSIGFRNEGINTTMVACDAPGSTTKASTSAGALQTEMIVGNQFTNDRLVMTSAATGRASVEARGESTNIDIMFEPKGSGVLRFGTFTASGSVSTTGYITVKDAAGTTRRIAVVT